MTFDVDRMLRLPRTEGLALSLDGRRLVASVSGLAPDGKKLVSSVWELDPDGERAPRRLTRSAPGERAAAFLPDGGLLFTSTRPDPDAAPGGDGDAKGNGAKGHGEDVAALWLLPPGGGEARAVASAPGGIGAVAVARSTGTVAYAAERFPGADTDEDDKARAKARKDAGVSAQLFEEYPIRHWDHYLGPRERRLLVAPPPADDERMQAGRDLTPQPGQALDEVGFDISADGSTVFSGWRTPEGLEFRFQLVALDAATGERTVLLDHPEASFDQPAASPDGRFLVCVREEHGGVEDAPDVTLWLYDLSTGEGRDLLPGFDFWPGGPVWAPDGSAVLFTADVDGHSPVFRVEVTGGHAGAVTRLTALGAYSSLCVSPDGTRVYALRSSWVSPPGAVLLDARATEQEGRDLPSPGLPLELATRMERVETTASDGTRVPSWLLLPAGASADQPAPLVLWIHGGPLASWNAWHWRWNPHVFTDRGYAVLLPDPALSTGYGRDYIQRGWSRWGAEPYTDLVAAVDAAVARPDIDEARTAAMGGSFGGYMANWVAGRTDRFRCVVTHASLWSLEQFGATTDEAGYWIREFGPPDEAAERYRAHSPDARLASIHTPMLVIHGERDYRVPVGEALRLWTDLQRRGLDGKFLYFPDENHWILKPGNIRVWYQTILAFLDHHVLGKDWTRPELL